MKIRKEYLQIRSETFDFWSRGDHKKEGEFSVWNTGLFRRALKGQNTFDESCAKCRREGKLDPLKGQVGSLEGSWKRVLWNGQAKRSCKRVGYLTVRNSFVCLLALFNDTFTLTSSSVPKSPLKGRKVERQGKEAPGRYATRTTPSLKIPLLNVLREVTPLLTIALLEHTSTHRTRCFQ